MKKKLSRHCPICGFQQGDVLVYISLVPVEDEHLASDFHVCLCERCGFCFDDLDATQDDFDAYYKMSGKYAQANTGGSGGMSEADMKRWSHVCSILSPFLAREKRIVDVGCGKGGLLMALRAQGFKNVVGIEPSSGCREEILAQGVCACYRDVTECLRNESPFDFVICSQVLEHVFSLDIFLTDIKRLLCPEGLVYVEVPDGAGYSGCFHAPFYYFDREHINHFSKGSLNNLFAVHLNCRPLFGESACAEPIAGVFTPNLYAVYQPCHEKLTVDPDVCGIKAFESYVKLSEEMDRYPEIESLKDSKTPILLWGLGAHLRRLIGKGVFSGLPLKGIVDRDKGGRGQCLAGYPILAPRELLSPQFQDVTVIITSVLYARQIHEGLTDQCFSGRVIHLSD